MKKTLFIFGVVLVIAVIIVWRVSFTTEEEQPVVKIGFNIQRVMLSGVIAVAEEQGLFDNVGVRVEPVLLKSGGEVMQALATGGAHIGMSGTEVFFIPIIEGAPIKIIAPLGADSSRLLYVRPDSGIETLQDLVGKTFAARLGTPPYIALQSAFKKEGVDTSAMEFIEIERALIPTALMNQRIVDVVVVNQLEEKKLIESGAKIFEPWVKSGYHKSPFPQIAIGVNSDFMSANQDAIQRTVKALIESQRFIATHPDEAAVLVSRYIEQGTDGAVVFSPEDILENWESTKYLLWCDPQFVQELASIAHDAGAIDRPLIVDEIFDLRFADMLSAAQQEVYGPAN